MASGLCQFICNFLFCSVQFSSVAQSCLNLSTPWTAAHQASLSINNSRRWLKLLSIEMVMPSNHLILYHPLLLPPCLSQHQGLFQWVSSSHQVAKVWLSVSASVLPMNIQVGYPLGWTLKSLLQHHSSKALILWHSAFFIVQLSHPYMTTGKTITWTRRI